MGSNHVQKFTILNILDKIFSRHLDDVHLEAHIAMHIKSQMRIPLGLVDSFYDPIIYFIANCIYINGVCARAQPVHFKGRHTNGRINRCVFQTKSITRGPLTFHSYSRARL